MDIVITEFQNRTKPNGKVKRITWEDLVERLKNPVITDETLAEYRSMTNEERTSIKDVGGYVAGEFESGRRSKDKLKSRYVLTIDADDATDHDVEDFEAMENFVFFVHTTHTSTPEKPRLRWLFPLARPVTSEEYRLLVSYMQALVGADTIDETTDQPERLMFWPSVPLDADYQYWSGGSVVLNPDDILDEVDVEDIPVMPRSTSSPSSDTTVFDGELGEGQRNNGVFVFVSRLRNAGLDKDEILDMARLYNENHCNPPLPDHEVRTIVHSVCSRYNKGELIPFSMFNADADFGDLGEVKKEAPKFLFGERCIEDLWAENLEDQEFIVEGLIPTGVGGIIAPPKFGKSWLCLDLCIAVATGTPFLGFKTTQHEVLYLALEDGKRRLNRRSKIVAAEDRKTLKRNLHFELKAPTLDNGLLKELEGYLKRNPETKLIVIDTLQKVRGEMKRGESVYQYDYREISDLHNFAIDHDIAVVLVHHTKKGIDDSDPLANASGSNGVVGSLDFSLNLVKRKRSDKVTKMAVIGRDTEEETYVLQFDKSACIWINLGKEIEVQLDTTDEAYESDPLVKTIKYRLGEIANAIPDDDLFTEEVVWEVTAKQLLESMEALCGETPYNSSIAVGMKLSKIAELLKAKDGIEYTPGPDTSKRTHRFTAERF